MARERTSYRVLLSYDDDGRSVGSRVRKLRVLRERTERAAREMHDETRKLTATLVAQGLTVRDIGELLGISYQRVQQIIKGE